MVLVWFGIVLVWFWYGVGIVLLCFDMVLVWFWYGVRICLACFGMFFCMALVWF